MSTYLSNVIFTSLFKRYVGTEATAARNTDLSSFPPNPPPILLVLQTTFEWQAEHVSNKQSSDDAWGTAEEEYYHVTIYKVKSWNPFSAYKRTRVTKNMHINLS